MQGWKKGVKMRLQNMFKKTGERENPVRKGRLRRRPEAPEGLLKKCNKCGAAILSEEVINGAYICPKCHGYFRVPAYKRIEMIADEGSFEEWDMDLDGMDGPPDSSRTPIARAREAPPSLGATMRKAQVCRSRVLGSLAITTSGRCRLASPWLKESRACGT